MGVKLKGRTWFAVLVVVVALVGVGVSAPSAAAAQSAPGYVLAAADGGVFAFGRAFHGSAANLPLLAPIVGIASTPSGDGYWLVAADGGVFAYGDARFFGSMGGIPLNDDVVGIAATPDGGGYWLVGADGGVFAFGDAGFFGSLVGQHILAPVVGISTTGDGKGYWLLTETGEVFALGDALAPGAPPALQAPVDDYSGIAPIPGTTRGIVIVTLDGTRIAFDAEASGCPANATLDFDLNAPIIGIAMRSAAGCQELLGAFDGGVFALGAPFLGSAATLPLRAPILGIAT
jgi:hypothetical protein